VFAFLLQAQDQLVPFTGGETLPATPLIYAAYALVWLVLLVYVFTLWQRIGKVERDLKDVSAKIKTAR
jgi:CcmD family protein